MKVVGLESGRVSYLVDLLEISPSGGIAFDALASALQARYDFAVIPNLPTQDSQQSQSGLRFEHGRLRDEARSLISYFEIHPQGLVAQAIDTRVAEEFFEDLFATGKNDFGLRAPTSPTKKTYTSSLVVDFETDMDRLLSKWDRLSALLFGQVKKFYQIDVPPGIQRITLRPDPELLPPRLAGGLLGDFTLERRVFAPYSGQRFYSIAPLPTDAHTLFLVELEKLVL